MEAVWDAVMEESLAVIIVLSAGTFVLVAMLGFYLGAEHSETRERLDRMERHLRGRDNE